ncbi:MAG: hypothetical protein GY797_25340, partial [Deltaproteobacteria bacterium]|nr:hypothetical protein [Deltaproteobacteria bacterium]
TSGQQAAINLDEIWLVTIKKPACAGPRIGAKIRPDSLKFKTPDELIRYWLAWEEQNPCYYREEANCMGAALEVSVLYTDLSSHEVDILGNTDYQRDTDGYGNVENWPDLEENFFSSGYFKLDPSKHENPGDIITYQLEGKRSEKYYPGVSSEFPTHMVVVIDHQIDKQQLCFEKQATAGYYQIKPCSDLGQYTTQPHDIRVRRWMGHTLGFNQTHFSPQDP